MNKIMYKIIIHNNELDDNYNYNSNIYHIY